MTSFSRIRDEHEYEYKLTTIIDVYGDDDDEDIIVSWTIRCFIELIKMLSSWLPSTSLFLFLSLLLHECR